MLQQTINKPIGEVLREAGLISSAQLAVALQDQQYRPDLRIGDILELRGWVKRDIIEFFAQQWPQVAREPRDQPIGYYFQQAGLLNAQQIQALLKEQLQAGMRIGALAVLRGWLSQKTVDLFLRYLAPEDYFASPFIRHSQRNQMDQPPSDQQTTDLETPRPIKEPFVIEPQVKTYTNPDPGEIPWVD